MHICIGLMARETTADSRHETSKTCRDINMPLSCISRCRIGRPSALEVNENQPYLTGAEDAILESIYEWIVTLAITR